MKALAFQNRLVRDLDVPSAADLTADIRQEILDAINGALQTLYALSDPDSKIIRGAISVDAPKVVTFDVTNGSPEISGHLFEAAELYRALRIDGDVIDNQPTGTATLLHPYTGPTGTVSATLYCDTIQIPEPYAEVISTELINIEDQSLIRSAQFQLSNLRTRRVGMPRFFKVEANARFQPSPAPALLKFDSLPNSAFRMEGDFSIAPFRIYLPDLLTSGADIPLRDHQIESYLLPIARSLLTSSSLWRDAKTKDAVNAAGLAAEQKYGVLAQRTLATPRNKVGTAPGY